MGVERAVRGPALTFGRSWKPLPLAYKPSLLFSGGTRVMVVPPRARNAGFDRFKNEGGRCGSEGPDSLWQPERQRGHEVGFAP